jgi:hypothetical protein
MTDGSRVGATTGRLIAAKVFRVLGQIWLSLLGVLILVGWIGIIWKEGWMRMTEVFSPFNLWNWGAILVCAAPGLACMFIADKLQQRGGSREAGHR